MNNIYHQQDFLAHKDSTAIVKLVDNLYAKCFGIARRYCGSDELAKNYSKTCFLNTLQHFLRQEKEEFDDNSFIHFYIICLVKNILSNRKGELIADTTVVTVFKNKEGNLFSSSEYYKNLSEEDIIQYLRKINSIQQIIYNLIYIDNFSIQETAEIIQHSELSIKALLEKAKYNLFSFIKTTV
jgi:DNA-directed RNA polymerase specialized sigma24 family protein